MKVKSYVLLIFLGLALVFIVGVRYGQRVEYTNKVIKLVLSITPTQPPATPKPLQFNTYTHKGCGVNFLIPSTVVLDKESSKSAEFKQQTSKQPLIIDCASENPLSLLFSDKKTATEEVMFNNKKTEGRQINNNSAYVLKLYNPQTGRYVYVEISKNLFPLFEKSLQYVP